MSQKSAFRRKNRIRIGGVTFDAVLILLLLIFCVIILYPFLNVIAVSLSSSRMITRGAVGILPRELNVKGYEIVFSQPAIYTAYLWTLWYCVLFTVLNVSLTACLGYALSVQEFKLRGFFSLILLITMFFNGGTIPSYLNIRNLGLMNTTWALVLPTCVSAWNVFMYRSFFKGISHEIREAALIDGAGEFRIMVKIMLPLSKPLMATLSIWIISGVWNAYMAPAIYLTDSAKFTLQQVLRSIVLEADMASYDITLDGSGGGTGRILDQIRYATLIVSMLPMLLSSV
jgi:putative aldouronate transport system permease protein